MNTRKIVINEPLKLINGSKRIKSTPAHRVRNNINIAHYPMFNAETVLSVNACDTKKDALTLANYWNECSKKNGCYMFKRVFDNSGNVTGFESF